MSASTPVPTSITRDGADRLVIIWNDGVRMVYTWPHLRKNCPCASCREERDKPADPFRILKPNEMTVGPLQPTAMSPVGRYAYKIAWNDGHDTGIYSFEQLLALDQEELH